MFTKALPSFFTVGNLFLGIMSILLSIQNSWQAAAIMVIVAMLLDGLDGRVARMFNTQSEFGKELDSLSDVISFGVAPAVIMYVAVFRDAGLEGWLVTALFPICGALRLARFNVYPSGPDYFVGLPITIAGGILSSLALYKEYMSSSYLLMFGMVFLSFLMVSQIKYPTFKKTGVPKSAYWLVPLFLIALTISAIFYQRELPKVIFIPLFLYALYGIKKSIDLRRQEDESDDEPVHDANGR